MYLSSLKGLWHSNPQASSIKTFYDCNYLSTTPLDRKSIGRTSFRQHVMFVEADLTTNPHPSIRPLNIAIQPPTCR